MKPNLVVTHFPFPKIPTKHWKQSMGKPSFTFSVFLYVILSHPMNAAGTKDWVVTKVP